MLHRRSCAASATPRPRTDTHGGARLGSNCDHPEDSNAVVNIAFTPSLAGTNWTKFIAAELWLPSTLNVPPGQQAPPANGTVYV